MAPLSDKSKLNMLEEGTLVTQDGTLSTLFENPDNARALCILGHGAGADMRHKHMTSLSMSLADAGIATFRYNFPFKEQGKMRVDSLTTCIQVISAVINAVQSRDIGLPVFLCGHSFGGRMSSHLAARFKPKIEGLIYFSFPLHPAGKPDVKRAKHLGEIEVPQLFLSGDRDKLADLDLLTATIAKHKNAQLHLLDTADHSFVILKRRRALDIDVYVEAAQVARNWIDDVINNRLNK